jgi:ABC-type dipeptide/oligopeptide/nickel transport system ATPase subunit
MSAPQRKFDDVPAVRESVPLLIGLMGPSGSGKTYSALRLATGIQEVTGGDIYFIDSEARRALHYADSFKFKHVQLDPPFGSLDYLAAIEHCVKQGRQGHHHRQHDARAYRARRLPAHPGRRSRAHGRQRLRQARARQDGRLDQARRRCASG